MINTLDPITCAALAKVFEKQAKENRNDLEVGTYVLDEDVRLSVKGTVNVLEDTEKAPTVNIPLLPAMALLLRRMGAQREQAFEILREVMTEALTLTDPNADATKQLLEQTGVAEAMAQLKKKVIDKLPKVPQRGQVRVQVIVNNVEDDEE